MTPQERGRMGGQATVARYGKEHMSMIGKRGFKAPCRKFPLNSRRLALYHLNGKGAMRAQYVSRKPSIEESEAAYRQCAREIDPDGSMGLNDEANSDQDIPSWAREREHDGHQVPDNPGELVRLPGRVPHGR